MKEKSIWYGPDFSGNNIENVRIFAIISWAVLT
jgi:hypothetical protein